MDLYNDWRRRALSLLQSYFLYIRYICTTTTYKCAYIYEYVCIYIYIVFRPLTPVQLSNCQRMCPRLRTRASIITVCINKCLALSYSEHITMWYAQGRTHIWWKLVKMTSPHKPHYSERILFINRINRRQYTNECGRDFFIYSVRLPFIWIVELYVWLTL